MRLKQKDIKVWRDKLLKEQGGICPLCKKPVHDDPVLDHCHDTGKIRGVLHRQCNHAEGRIKDWIKRTGKDNDPVMFLKHLVMYLTRTYDHNPTHPTHKTEVEKQILQLKRKQRKVKKPETKKKYQDMINELETQCKK